MDANKGQKGEEDEQLQQQETTAPIPRSVKGKGSSRSISSVSSLDSKASSLGSKADDRLSSDMDGVGDAYRRRRAQLLAGLENGSAKSKRQGRKNVRRHRQNGLANPDDKQTAYSSDEGHASDFSSLSTSDDVELSQLASGDGLTDDEETGLTKKDKEHRKRKRRRHTRLDGRIAGTAKTSTQEQRAADKNVLKAMIINVLLILAWYLFSLSISIVSPVLQSDCAVVTDCVTVQQMDVHGKVPRLSFPPLYNLLAHARPVLPRYPRPIFRPAATASIR